MVTGVSVATIKNLLIRIGVTDAGVERGVSRVNRQLDSVAKRVDRLEKIGRGGAFAALAGSAVSLGRAFAPAIASIGHLALVAAPAAVGALLTIPAAILSVVAAQAVFRVGMAGMGEAMKAVASGDAKQLDVALRNLSPSAQSFVIMMARIKKTFDPIRKAVQERLFSGLAKDMENLTVRNLPTLRTGMTSVAGSMNELARSALRSVNTPMFSGVMAKVLALTATTLRSMAKPLGDLISGIVRLVSISLPLLSVITKTVVKYLAAKAAWVNSAAAADKVSKAVDRSTGSMAKGGRAATALHDAHVKLHAAFASVQRIGKNLWSVLKSVGQAVQDSTKPSKSLLDLVTQLTGRMAAWAKSAKGQEQIRTLFSSLQQLASNLTEILPQLGGVLTLILGVINALPGPVRGVVLQMAAWSIILSRFSGPITGAAGLIGSFTTKTGKANAAVRAIGSGAGKFATAMVGVGQAAGTAAVQIARVVAGWVLMGVQSLIQAARMAAAWVIAMGPVGWIIAGVVALVALIILNWGTVKKYTVEVWHAVWGFISGVVSKVVGFVKQHWQLLIAIIGGPFGIILGLVIKNWDAIWKFVQKAVSGVISAVMWLARLPGMVAGWFYSMAVGAIKYAGGMLKQITGIPGRIMGTFASAGKWLYNAGKNIMVGLWNGIASLGSWLYNRLMSLVRAVIPGPIRRALGIASPSKVTTKLGQYAGQGLANGILSTTGLVQRAANTLAFAAVPNMSGSSSTAYGSPSGVISARASGTSGGGGGVDAALLARAVKDALHGTSVQMDGKPVGQIISRHLGRDTDLRRRAR